MNDGEMILDLVYFAQKIPIMMDTSVGKHKRLEGWVPNYPIFLVPGFASSVLQCETSRLGYKSSRIWLDINNLLGAKLGEMLGKSI